jgi:hypothetical protein
MERLYILFWRCLISLSFVRYFVPSISDFTLSELDCNNFCLTINYKTCRGGVSPPFPRPFPALSPPFPRPFPARSSLICPNPLPTQLQCPSRRFIENTIT